MKEKKITKEELYKNYIIDNMNMVDIAKKYNVSISSISKKMKKFNIKKDKKQIIKNTTETNIKRRGKNYLKKTKEQIEKTKQTCLKRYGTVNPMQNNEIRNKAKKKIKENNSNLQKRKEIQ